MADCRQFLGILAVCLTRIALAHTAKNVPVCEHSLLAAKHTVLSSVVGGVRALNPSTGHMRLLDVEALLQRVVSGTTKGVNLADEAEDSIEAIRKVIGTAKPNFTQQHQADQDDIDDALLGAIECSDNGVAEALEDAETKRVSHAMCRRSEVGIAAEGPACKNYTKARKGLDSSSPGCSVGKASSDDPQELKSFEACFSRNFTHWYEPIRALYEACNDETEQRREECRQNQTAFEGSFCVAASKHDDYCQCWERASTSYNRSVARVQTAEAARKADFEAAERINCWFKIWESQAEHKEDALVNCSDTTIDTSNLTIRYGNLSAPIVSCPAAASRPCDDDWERQEYKLQDWYTSSPTTCISSCGASTLAPATEALTSSPPTTVAPEVLRVAGWADKCCNGQGKLYSGVTTPCDVNSFVAALPAGSGYYYDPDIAAGYCRSIAPDKVAEVRQAYAESRWHNHPTSVTVLPEASAPEPTPAS